MRAYLTEGELIGDTAVLERLAVEVGLPADEVRDVLSGDRYADDVRDDERTAAGLGIRAVPFFVVDRAVGASGAQPPHVLGEMLRRVWSDQDDVPARASCGPTAAERFVRGETWRSRSSPVSSSARRNPAASGPR